MLLDLTNLAKNEKLIGLASPRTGMKKKDSLYFDFEKKKIFVHSDFMVAYITFDFSLSEGEKIKNIFFDTSKLFVILKNFDASEVELILDSSDEEFIPKFLKGKDEYVIEHLFEDEEDFETSFTEESINFEIDSFLSSLIKEAYLFVEQAKDNQFNSIALNKEGIYGVTPARFYEYKTNIFSSNLKEDSEPIKIHRDVAKFIASLKEPCKCSYSEGKIKFSLDNIFEFVFAIPYNHTVIPSDSDKENVLSLKNKLVIDRKMFLENLKFFDPFYSLDSKPVKLTVLSESDLELSTVSDFDTIKKILPLKEGNKSLIGFSAEYNGDIIKLALNIFNKDVDVFLNEDKIGMLLSEQEDLLKTISIMRYQ